MRVSPPLPPHSNAPPCRRASAFGLPSSTSRASWSSSMSAPGGGAIRRTSQPSLIVFPFGLVKLLPRVLGQVQRLHGPLVRVS